MRIESRLPLRALAALYEGLPAGILTVGASGVILGVNDAAARLCGLDAEAFCDRNIADLDWEMTDSWASLLGNHPENSHARTVELRTPNGSRQIKIWIVSCEGGEPAQEFHIIALDFTEERRAHEVLRTSEDKYRHFVETSHDLVWSVDLDWQLIYLNPATRAIYGCDREEMLGRKLIDLAAPEWREKDSASFQRILRGENLFHYETQHTAKDGRPVFLSLNAMPLRDATGQIIGATGTGVDISQRKQAEMAIEKLAAFPRFNPYAVFEFSQEGEITYYNAASLELAKSFDKSHPQGILPPTAQQIVISCLARNQSRLRLENTMDGRTISWSFFPIQQSRVVHCYASEITERQNLENQLRQSQKMECVGQLAGGIAHDFNNILTIIQGHVSLLKLESSGISVMEESLNEILMASDRAVSLTHQLLAFSRKQVIQPRKLDLNEVIRNMSRMLRPILSEAIKLELRFAEALPSTRADQGMIEQILLNLVINSRDAMPNGGKVVIETSSCDLKEAESGRIPESRTGPCVCLAVTDNGLGIRSEHLQHIFEPFFTTKEVGKGTGLGLATVYGIVKQHQGWIQATSDWGKATTFKIFLPVFEASETPVAPPRPFDRAKRGFGTILVVEDEDRLRELICVILANQGYKVLGAANATKALEIWKIHHREIRLLLSDVVMPDGINGLELSNRLLEEKPDLKVILSSGYSPQVAGRDLTRMDKLAYLQKPYAPQSLIDVIHQSLALPEVG